MAELEIRWPSADYADTPIGDPLDFEDVSGMTPSEVEHVVAKVPEFRGLAARASSHGKGASGPAFALVIELERYATDAATLIVIGTALKELIAAVGRKVRSRAVVEDPNTLGALAAASNQEAEPFDEQEVDGLRYISTVPVTAYPGLGTNAGDIWAACFRTKSNDAIVIFLSPHGTWLGRVTVPAEYYFDTGHNACQRTDEEIQEWWS